MGRKRESRISILKTLYDSVGGFERALTKDEYFAMRWLSSKGLLNYCRMTTLKAVEDKLEIVDDGNKFVIKPTIFFLYLKYSLEFTAEEIYYEVQEFYREHRSLFVNDSLTDVEDVEDSLTTVEDSSTDSLTDIEEDTEDD